MTDLKIYDYQNPSMTPLATTMGIFLDKCNPDLREKIIDRLIKLQQGEIEVKDYKMIDEYILEEARDKLEQEKKTKAKRTVRYYLSVVKNKFPFIANPLACRISQTLSARSPAKRLRQGINFYPF